ncbi:conserved glutamic acid-rich protein [Talaromyces stipitatus ATCC 10500]|uniref:Conserved glutamic acid-rich protein n=1 Tax=Talaromyces stipitatus (strain ATCC 10500 / CBS 375.48 / QM 6759 / NRRL 1006) TaxID=441959 RepID=B8M1Z4_TALSN|nr:conserved glutamic acid-rich protein [Talaromyces stipitatus ATCC 10500]EED21372.1 conserved glutamic acid-rich protein [Talaromyces stipitatus ATCC 10500]
MEDPFADTMEMASPYTGHVDDFEIDIDIMEDQPSNVDDDFDLQDASPGAAAGDLTNDSDMMDDVPEMTVTDTSTYNNDGNMQYAENTFFTTQEPVESEMVDEDYEENDETVPSTFETFTTQQDQVNLTEAAEPADDQAKEEVSRDVGEQNIEEVVEETQTALQETVNRETTQEGPHESKVEEPSTITEAQGESVTEHHPDDPAEAHEVAEGTKEVPSDTAIIDPGIEDRLAGAPDDVENNRLNDAGETLVVVENEHDFVEQQHKPHIHPVKVIYQESEISMFPPLHGDTSETYFLANEGLAHENIDRLFKECRTILGDHASDEESLVFHIDSLGIELSEDNTHVCKFTLSQIVDTYLHLCRNSGIEQPEPLYLTLNTRANLSSELAALLNAAMQGKGISDIQNWEEEYEHEEGEDKEVSSRGDLSEQNPEEDEHGEQTHREEEEAQNNSVEDELAESHDAPREDLQQDAQDDFVEAHEESEQAGIDTTNTQEHHDEEEDGELNNEGQELTETQPHPESHDNIGQTVPPYTSDNEPSAGSEHQQQEESTATGQDAVVAGGTDFAGGGTQDPSLNEHAVVLEAHVDEEDREEHASTENDVTTAGPTDPSEVAPTTEQHDKRGGYEDDEETADQEFTEKEDEYGEDTGEENYDDYAEEEYREEPAAGVEYTEELLVSQDGHNDDSYVADQFDQASSKTVSASNELVDNNDDMPDNLWTGTKIDAAEGHDYAQEISDLPELPDNDLLSLDEDIFADTEQASHRETGDDNGLDESHIDDGHATSVEQATATNDDTQNAELKRQGSTIGKRSRADEEEEIDFDGLSSPGTKRTRSS